MAMGSDSSMDDCNYKERARQFAFGAVQIPLWTIVTSSDRSNSKNSASSDSSMDDCNTIGPTGSISNLVFRFLYGRL